MSESTSQGEDDIKHIESASSSERVIRQPCTEYLDVMMYCFGIRYQLSSYYRTGNVDDCKKQRSQFFLCLQLKMNRPDEERYEMWRKLKRRDEFAFTAGIWPMRKDPAADWPNIRGSGQPSDSI